MELSVSWHFLVCFRQSEPSQVSGKNHAKNHGLPGWRRKHVGQTANELYEPNKMLMKFQTAVENDGYVSSFFLEHRASVEYLLTRQISRRLLKAILDLKDSHWVNERTDFTLKNRRLIRNCSSHGLKFQALIFVEFYCTRKTWLRISYQVNPKTSIVTGF